MSPAIQLISMPKFKFRPYQLKAASELSDILLKRRFAIDASETGVGKTFTSLATAKEFDPTPPVALICKASARTKWIYAFESVGIKPLFVMSWDNARNKKNPFFIPVINRRGKVTDFNLRLEEPTILIIDEIHGASNPKSLNSKLVIGARRCSKAYVLGLSATIAHSPLNLGAVGYCLRLHNMVDYWQWCLKNGCGKGPFGGLYFKVKTREKVLGKLHDYIFSKKDPWGIRLRRKDLVEQGQFPQSETYVELWDIQGSPPKWLHGYLEEVNRRRDVDEEKHELVHGGIIQMRERQESELLKVPCLIGEIDQILEEGQAAVIFVQFTQTIEAISSQFDPEEISIIAGQIPKSLGRRIKDHEIENFQMNRTRICLCQIDAGSESIDLHDITGVYPRSVIIFPTYKPVTLIQALGRCVRSGGLSPVTQRIVYAAGGLEEKIAKTIERRLENLSLITIGELNAGAMI